MTLTELYKKYNESTGTLKELYGTFYYMYGGKKKVEKQMAFLWYISSIEGISRVDKKYNNDLDRNDTISDECVKHYCRAFKSNLDYLKYLFKLNYELTNINTHSGEKLNGVILAGIRDLLSFSIRCDIFVKYDIYLVTNKIVRLLYVDKMDIFIEDLEKIAVETYQSMGNKSFHFN